MYRTLIIIVLLSAIFTAPAVAQAPNQLTEKEKARIQDQVQALKNSKLKQGEIINKNTKNDAIRQGQNIDQKVDQANKNIDSAVDNYSSRFGNDFAKTVGNAKKAEIKQMGAAEKEKLANEARAKSARQAESAKKAAESIDESVDGLKSQVSKSGKFGLTPKGSNPYVRNYAGKANK